MEFGMRYRNAGHWGNKKNYASILALNDLAFGRRLVLYVRKQSQYNGIGRRQTRVRLPLERG